MPHMNKLPANKSFDRTVRQSGRTVLVMDCALAGAQVQPLNYFR